MESCSWHWLPLPGDAGLRWGFSRPWPERACPRCKPRQPQATALPCQGEPGLRRGSSSLRPHPVPQAFFQPRVLWCPNPGAEGNLSRNRAGESYPGPPPGGLGTSLQAFRDTCVLPFFFFSFFFFLFAIISHSGESKHKQTNLTTTQQVQTGRERHDIYVYVQLLQWTDSIASSWDGRTISKWACPLVGVWRADDMHLKLSSVGLSERLAVIGWGGSEGQGTGPLPGACLPNPVPSLTTRTPRLLQHSTGRGWSSGRERLSKPTSRGTAEPHPGLATPHVWVGGRSGHRVHREEQVSWMSVT